jgi:hypothetical protein
LNGAYPEPARSQQVGGTSLMACKVQSDGTLGACKAFGEEPEGMGFGEAATHLGRYFKLRPGTFDHLPVPNTLFLAFSWTPTAVLGSPPEVFRRMPAPYLFGDEAAIVDGLNANPGAALPQAVACFTPNSTKPCKIHALEWRATPSLSLRLEAVLNGGRDQGSDLILCNVDKGGQLKNCVATSDAASAVVKDVGDSFVAPAWTDDGASTAKGYVVMILDWKRLHSASLAVVPGG